MWECNEIGWRPPTSHGCLGAVYGRKLLDEDVKSHTKEITDAADRYGVVSQKLEAEACFMENTTFIIDNAMKHLLNAHPTNCPFLKEIVLDFLFENEAEGGYIHSHTFEDEPNVSKT